MNQYFFQGKDFDSSLSCKFIKIIFKSFFAFTIIVIMISCEREVSVTPPDVLPPNGSMFIDSRPADAQIFINGKDRRRSTPDSIKWLETGDYIVTLKRNLFRDTTFIIHVDEGERSDILIDYYGSQAMLGFLKCTSVPSNAHITINDSVTDHVTPYTFVNIIPGEYKIKYTLENYRSTEFTASVASGITSTANAALVDTTIWKDYNVNNQMLPTNLLTCVLSASGPRGALWIGTENTGLIKFVREQWIKYDATNSLISHNHIICLEQDSIGKLWVGTQDGLNQIQPNLYHTDPRPDDDIEQWNFRNSSLLNMQINGIGAEDGTEAWFGTEVGIARLRRIDYEYLWGPSLTSANSSLPEDKTTAMASANQKFYVGTYTKGLVEFAGYNNMKIHNTSTGMFRNNVSAIAVAANDVIWVGHKSAVGVSGGLSKFNGVSWENYSFYINGENVNDIKIDTKNRVWIGTGSGLYLIANSILIGEYNFETTGLPFDNITGITEDKDGFIWITSYGNGLYRMNAN